MAGLLATIEARILLGFVVASGAKQSRIPDTIDRLIKTFYLIRITKGRRKQRTVLRGSILMG
jgi:hypothetical protein